MLVSNLMFICSIELPDQVSDVKITDYNSTSVNVSWHSKKKGKPWYYTVLLRIDCSSCNILNDSSFETEWKSVVLKNLSSSTRYNISIAVNNNITDLTGVVNPRFFVFITGVGGEESLLRFLPIYSLIITQNI